MTRITGSSQLAKSINKVLLLQNIRKSGAISRTELVEATGLTSGTVSNITNDLIEEGLIAVKGRAGSTGGRPQVLLEINNNARLAVGTNVGSTKVISVLTRLDGSILSRSDLPMERAWSLERQVKQIARSISDVFPQSEEQKRRVLGIGLGIPGLLTSGNGVSVFSPNLGWRNVPIKSLIEDQVACPVTLDNSVRVGALGERWWGTASQVSNLVALYVGTGVGAGLIINGQIYKGHNEAAGEIGHVVVSEGGARCSCGKSGCLEAVASGPAIAKRALSRIRAGEKSLLQDMNVDESLITSEHVYQAAKKGDALSLEVLEEAAHFIGIGMSILINLFNPQVLVFNGGVSNSWDITGPAILKTAQALIFEGSNPDIKIIRSSLGDSVGPLGAATLVIEQFFSLPGVNTR